MPQRLFNLRGVPEDELEEIRALLRENRIDFYETPAGNWGISSPGLWLDSEQQLDQARALLDDYQRARAMRSRAEYQRLKEQGEAESLWGRLYSDPLRFFFYLALIALVLYLSISPFLSLS